MATRYADRAFLTINGAAIADVQNATLRQNHNARPVPSMTRRRFNRGYVRGNTDIDVDFTIGVLNTLSRPKVESLPFDTANVGLSFEVGADLFQCNGLFIKNNEDGAGGIGDEVKASFSLGALELVDTVGNSVLFDIVL